MSYTLEEIARTSDDGAVRRAFAARNLASVRLLSIFFFFIALAMTIGAIVKRNPVQVPVGLIALASVVVFGRGARRAPPRYAAFVPRHVTAASIAFVAIETACLVAFNYFAGPGGHVVMKMGDGTIAWAIVIPLVMIGFRMAPIELAMLHGSLLVLTYPLSVQDSGAPFIAVAIINALAFGYEAWASRRLRQQTVGEWRERSAQAREQIRMRDELRYARELQLSMLPESAPDIAWLEIDGASLPATEVGGDYFDYFVSDERVALVCADVAGHGMASFLFISALRSGFMLLRDTLDRPALVLERLRGLVEQTSRRRMLVTASLAVFDPREQRVTFASAGHPPAIVRRSSGSVEMIELFAPPLGARLGADIPQRHVPIASGDIVVLHSDGIYECVNAAGDSYGLDRLMDVVRTSDASEARTMREAILRDVELYRGAASQTDDVTVVVARVK